MFFNQDSTVVLKAQLANAVATSQSEISVTYKDNTDAYHPDKIVATNSTTAVTLLDAPASGVINLVELIKIYNPDTQANIVQILANNTVIFTCTVGANQSAILSAEGVSNGLGYIPADSDLSNLTSTGKAKVSNLAMPSNTYIDVALGASGSTYTAPADGYFFMLKGGTAINQNLIIQNSSSGTIRVEGNATAIGTSVGLCVPARKNDTILYIYSLAGPTYYVRFIYAQGEV